MSRSKGDGRKAPSRRRSKEQDIATSIDETAKPFELVRNAMTPLANEDGSARGFGPYAPVLRACDVCPARCCRCQVKCSLPDAVHFCTTLGLPFFVPLEIVAAEPGPRTARIDADPRAISPEADWRGAVEIVLRRKEGACVSLLRVGGYERCGAYAARPMTCRIYPLSWQEGLDVHFGPSKILCAVPYAVTPSAELQLQADIVRYHEYWRLHEEVIAEWEARPDHAPRTLEAFLEFALPRTAEKMGVELGPTLARGSPDARLYQAMQGSKR